MACSWVTQTWNVERNPVLCQNRQADGPLLYTVQRWNMQEPPSHVRALTPGEAPATPMVSLNLRLRNCGEGPRKLCGPNWGCTAWGWCFGCSLTAATPSAPSPCWHACWPNPYSHPELPPPYLPELSLRQLSSLGSWGAPCQRSWADSMGSVCPSTVAPTRGCSQCPYVTANNVVPTQPCYVALCHL